MFRQFADVAAGKDNPAFAVHQKKSRYAVKLVLFGKRFSLFGQTAELPPRQVLFLQGLLPVRLFLVEGNTHKTDFSAIVLIYFPQENQAHPAGNTPRRPKVYQRISVGIHLGRQRHGFAIDTDHFIVLQRRPLHQPGGIVQVAAKIRQRGASIQTRSKELFQTIEISLVVSKSRLLQHAGNIKPDSQIIVATDKRPAHFLKFRLHRLHPAVIIRAPIPLLTECLYAITQRKSLLLITIISILGGRAFHPVILFFPDIIKPVCLRQTVNMRRRKGKPAIPGKKIQFITTHQFLTLAGTPDIIDIIQTELAQRGGIQFTTQFKFSSHNIGGSQFPVPPVSRPQRDFRTVHRTRNSAPQDKPVGRLLRTSRHPEPY